MSTVNLDQLCAQYGYAICEAVGDAFKGKDDKPDKAKTENHITKSLGVLQGDGVYAFFLYQASRGQREKPGADRLEEQAKMLLKEAGIQAFQNADDPLAAVRDHLANDLDQLLLAKRLLEQALIYARYHAKRFKDL